MHGLGVPVARALGAGTAAETVIMSFLEMGGYAAYVWPAFGITALIMIVMLVWSLRSVRAREATLKTLEASTGRGRRENRETGAPNTDTAS